MWWPDISARQWVRFTAARAIAGLTAGCFQPLYGDRAGPGGENAIVSAMRGVDVLPLSTPRGTRLDPLGSELPNDRIFGLPGGAGATSPTHRLTVSIGSGQQQIIVDIASG